jgi:hypothetical protein
MAMEMEAEVAAAVTMGTMETAETVKEAAETGMDGEEMMLMMVELGMEVTAEGI